MAEKMRLKKKVRKNARKPKTITVIKDIYSIDV
jgi:hypothetical protein